MKVRCVPIRKKLIIQAIVIEALTLLIFGLAGLILIHQREQKVKPIQEAFVMIPGSGTKADRFVQFQHDLNRVENKQGNYPHSMLEVTVEPNGRLVYKGKVSKLDRHPIITIAFSHNNDNYAVVKRDAKLLTLAMTQIKNKYQIRRFSGFGHSNGGLVWTYWLEHYRPEDYRINNIMLVGTPFNGYSNSSSLFIPQLRDLVKYRKNINPNINIINILGTTSYISDMRVPENSALAAKYIYQPVSHNYMAVTLTGKQVSHYELPQDSRLIQLIRDLVWHEDLGVKTMNMNNNSKK